MPGFDPVAALREGVDVPSVEAGYGVEVEAAEGFSGWEFGLPDETHDASV